MELKHTQGINRGVFYLEENGARIAHMDYIFSGEKRFIIEHTVVNPGNEGKGLGRKLVEAAVAFARKEHYKIVPVCSYAKKVLESSAEYNDVLF